MNNIVWEIIVKPYDEVMARNTKILESLGFICFDEDTDIILGKSYIYPNKLGNELLEFWSSKVDQE